MVIIYSILFNIMSEIDDGLHVIYIYILYAAHGYNIYIYIIIILLLDRHHEMCLGFSVAKIATTTCTNV